MTAVSRVGATVRRPVGAWTPRVHMLIVHLRAKHVLEVPAPLGLDDQGREVLAFIPGIVGHYPIPESLRTDDVLTSAARCLRRIHDATEDVARIRQSGWQSQAREPIEVICHGDFAPYNCVFDEGRLANRTWHTLFIDLLPSPPRPILTATEPSSINAGAPVFSATHMGCVHACESCSPSNHGSHIWKIVSARAPPGMTSAFRRVSTLVIWRFM